MAKKIDATSTRTVATLEDGAVLVIPRELWNRVELQGTTPHTVGCTVGAHKMGREMKAAGYTDEEIAEARKNAKRNIKTLINWTGARVDKLVSDYGLPMCTIRAPFNKAESVAELDRALDAHEGPFEFNWDNMAYHDALPWADAPQARGRKSRTYEEFVAALDEGGIDAVASWKVPLEFAAKAVQDGHMELTDLAKLAG